MRFVDGSTRIIFVAMMYSVLSGVTGFYFFLSSLALMFLRMEFSNSHFEMCLLSSTLWALFAIPIPLLRFPVLLSYPLIAAAHWIVQTWVHYCHSAPCWSVLLKSCYILRIWNVCLTPENVDSFSLYK